MIIYADGNRFKRKTSTYYVKKSNITSLNDNSQSRICWNMSGYTAEESSLCSDEYSNKLLFLTQGNFPIKYIGWNTYVCDVSHPCTVRILNILYIFKVDSLFGFLYLITLGIFTWKKFGRFPRNKQNKTETIFNAIDWNHLEKYWIKLYEPWDRIVIL